MALRVHVSIRVRVNSRPSPSRTQTRLLPWTGRTAAGRAPVGSSNSDSDSDDAKMGVRDTHPAPSGRPAARPLACPLARPLARPLAPPTPSPSWESRHRVAMLAAATAAARTAAGRAPVGFSDADEDSIPPLADYRYADDGGEYLGSDEDVHRAEALRRAELGIYLPDSTWRDGVNSDSDSADEESGVGRTPAAPSGRSAARPLAPPTSSSSLELRRPLATLAPTAAGRAPGGDSDDDSEFESDEDEFRFHMNKSRTTLRGRPAARSRARPMAYPMARPMARPLARPQANGDGPASLDPASASSGSDESEHDIGAPKPTHAAPSRPPERPPSESRCVHCATQSCATIGSVSAR